MILKTFISSVSFCLREKNGNWERSEISSTFFPKLSSEEWEYLG